MPRLFRVTTRSISSYLRRQPQDYYLDNYIRSLDFDGVQAQRISERLVLFGVGQSVYRDQESKMRSMADLVLEGEQSTISLLQISPEKYLSQGGTTNEVLPSELDTENRKISEYARIPLLEERQIHNKEETINSIIQAVESKVVDPEETLYYNYLPITVLALLKKNRVILADLPLDTLLRTAVRHTTNHELAQVLDRVTEQLKASALGDHLSLAQGLMVFEPQVLLFPQLEHLHCAIQSAILSNPEQHVAVYLNQEIYTIIKTYYASHSQDEDESLAPPPGLKEDEEKSMALLRRVLDTQ